MKSETTIESLSDDSIWKGGWYQDITLPSGERTKSTFYDFDDNQSRGIKKWEIAEPYIKGERFLDIGCNAGLHLVKANKKQMWGIDVSPYFLKQCRFILEKFNIKATLIEGNALDVELPEVDTTLMANALYWMVFSDEEGYIDNYLERLDDFLRRLSEKTKYLVLIGSENINRIGGSLDATTPFVNNHFTILEARPIELNDRTVNLIYAESRNQKAKKGTGKKN